MPDATVYFATNRKAEGDGFGADIVRPDPGLMTYGTIEVTNTDLTLPYSGTMGPVTDASMGTFGTATLNTIVNGPDNLLIFIHGFANSFDDAIKRAAYNKAWFAAGGAAGETTVVAFTWPSVGTVVEFGEDLTEPYKTDQKQAGNSGPHLARFFLEVETLVAAFRTLRPNRRAFLLVHSMGNWALQAGISAWFPMRRTNTSIFDEVFLAAPDEDFTSFEVPMGQRLTHLPDMGKRITIYYSGIDKILFMLSAPINGVQRLGTLGPNKMKDMTIYPPEKFRIRGCAFVDDYLHDSFDAVHQYYRKSPKVRTDIVAMMNGNPSGDRVADL
jgi:esterase/lipase superfamily enzyme